jgi:hypothetical protein
MNYIVSSIILLSVILIIIYLLSIDNNMERFSNKLKDIFNTVKSPKLNFLSEKDNINLLNFIKNSFKYDDNVTIPSKIYYNKTDNGYEINDLDIITYKYKNNGFMENTYKINILFVPFEKAHYTSNQSLLGMHGNYKMDIISHNKPVLHMDNQPDNISDKVEPVKKKKKSIEKPKDDIFMTDFSGSLEDLIPDVIHITSEQFSEDNTTDTVELITHNLE